MNSLYNIFNTTVLTEGRKEDVMAKYPAVPKETVEILSQNDPSGNNKYLEWMVRESEVGNISDDLIQTVRLFHEKQNLITPVNIQEFLEEVGFAGDNQRLLKQAKDIMTFPNLRELRKFAGFLSTITSKKKELDEIKKEGDRIYEDAELLVMSPRSHRCSVLYGKHSGWCVATANTGHFANYTKNGTLYFFISKVDKPYNKWWSDKDGGQPPYKIALLLKDDGSKSWWSKGDINYTDGWVGDPLLPFLTQEMGDKVLAHNKHAIQNRKQREIDLALQSSGFYSRNSSDTGIKGNFGGFVRSSIFSPEQLVSIIRNNNWLALYENSEVGKDVRKQLGSETVFSLLREMVTTTDDLASILKDMHSQEFLANNSMDFSDDQNRELAGIIVEKLGHKPTASEVGGDVKMYVDKWTMTPEAWTKYENTSSYFFIGNDNTIENLVKGDRFNPKDHHALQMMMLRAKMAKLGLYALVTDRNLLDDYVGQNDTEIPDSVKQTIKEKARKLNS